MGHGGISGEESPAARPQSNPANLDTYQRRNVAWLPCVFISCSGSSHYSQRGRQQGGWWCHLVAETEKNNTRGHSPVRVDAVFINHGFQGVRVSCRERERERVTRWERKAEITAVLGISAPVTSKSRALIERWLQQINSLTQLSGSARALNTTSSGENVRAEKTLSKQTSAWMWLLKV